MQVAFIARLSCRFCFSVADSGSLPLAVEQGCGFTTQNSYGHSSHSLRLTRTFIYYRQDDRNRTQFLFRLRLRPCKVDCNIFPLLAAYKHRADEHI